MEIGTLEIRKISFEQLRFDTWMSITRSNGQRIDCSVAHGYLLGNCPRLGIFIFTEDEDGERKFQQEVELSQAEARALRDFLNRPEVQTLLQ